MDHKQPSQSSKYSQQLNLLVRIKILLAKPGYLVDYQKLLAKTPKL